MKISSYLEHRARARQDYYKVLVSLRYRPRNWRWHWPFVMENHREKMCVWVANSVYGIDFTINGKKYWGVTPNPFMLLFESKWFGKRAKMYKTAIEVGN